MDNHSSNISPTAQKIGAQNYPYKRNISRQEETTISSWRSSNSIHIDLSVLSMMSDECGKNGRSTALIRDVAYDGYHLNVIDQKMDAKKQVFVFIQFDIAPLFAVNARQFTVKLPAFLAYQGIYWFGNLAVIIYENIAHRVFDKGVLRSETFSLYDFMQQSSKTHQDDRENIELDSIERDHIFLSAESYRLAFLKNRDYYSGINYALACNIMASRESDPFEAMAYYGRAIITRNEVIHICQEHISSPEFKQSSTVDQMWIYLAMAEAHFGLGQNDIEKKYLSEAQKVVGSKKYRFKAYYQQRSILAQAIARYQKKMERFD